MCPTPLRQVHDWTGEGPGDAVHCLHARDHELAELIEVPYLGADDHVVGTGDRLGLLHAREVDDVLGDLGAALPTSVWMRTYAVTTGTDLLASCPGALEEPVPKGWWHATARSAEPMAAVHRWFAAGARTSRPSQHWRRQDGRRL
jgi:hypothetical protein